MIKSKPTVLVCNDAPGRAFISYVQGWEVEILFSSLKTRGFNLNDIHMTAAAQLDKLLALLANAFAWAHLVCEWWHQVRLIKLKAHSYLAKSYFERDVNALRSAILTGNMPARINLYNYLKLLCL